MSGLSRRAFLKQSVSGVVFLSAAGAFTTSCRSYPRPQGTLKFFTDKEAAIFNAIADTMIPASDGVPGALAAGVPAAVDELLASFDEDIQSQFRQLLALFEHGPFMFAGSFKRFTAMSADERYAYMRGWAGSRLAVRRQGFVALKKFCMITYYCNPVSWGAIAFPGPLV